MPALAIFYFATLGGTVDSSSLPPTVLVLLLSLGVAWRIVAVSWNGYGGSPSLVEGRQKAFALHLATSIILEASPLVGLGR